MIFKKKGYGSQLNVCKCSWWKKKWGHKSSPLQHHWRWECTLAIRLCYCFGYDVTVRFIEMWMFQTSGHNRKWCKVKFLKKYLLWIGTSPVFTGCTRNFIKLHSFETPWRFIRKWTNLNIRRMTDGPFSAQIFQGCTFDPKKENPYWLPG